jgi:Uma2 family endonuclease
MIKTKKLAEDILEQLKTKDLVRIPASEDEYFSVAFDLPFQVEYHDSEIVTMGLSSFIHELIVTNMIYILKSCFKNDKSFKVTGSNSGIQIPKFEGGYYMPDVLILKGNPIFKRNSTAIITNPHIIIEVLSPKTHSFDLIEKLPEYKHLESLQQIIFINQKKMGVTVFTRQINSTVWLNQDFDKETDEVIIENYPVLLKDIYEQIEFAK